MQTIPVGAVELALCSARENGKEQVERQVTISYVSGSEQSCIHSLSIRVETNIVADVPRCMLL